MKEHEEASRSNSGGGDGILARVHQVGEEALTRIRTSPLSCAAPVTCTVPTFAILVALTRTPRGLHTPSVLCLRRRRQLSHVPFIARPRRPSQRRRGPSRLRGAAPLPHAPPVTRTHTATTFRIVFAPFSVGMAGGRLRTCTDPNTPPVVLTEMRLAVFVVAARTERAEAAWHRRDVPSVPMPCSRAHAGAEAVPIAFTYTGLAFKILATRLPALLQFVVVRT